jgi:hypothetical protein
MITDVVIPLVPGTNDCMELRLALRSIEKNMNSDVAIWIYGYAPPWIRNVNIVRTDRIHYPRFVTFRDTRRKIELAAGNDAIGPRFIYTYDDIYFMKPITIDELRKPIAKCNAASGNQWHAGTGASRNWMDCMRGTLEALHRENLPMWSYETHLPRVYNREKVKALAGKPLLRGNSEPEAVQYATWYYNHYLIDPVVVDSLKNYKLISGFDVPVSSLINDVKTHAILNANKYRVDVIKLLQDIFPLKSKYESDGEVKTMA